MIENYTAAFLEKHSQAIDAAATRCPAGGWQLHQAREECATILGLSTECHQFLQRAKRALEAHAKANPLLWARARRVSDHIVGGTFSRAAHESSDPEEKSRFLELWKEHDNFQMKFEGLLRALLQSGSWYAEGSPNGVLARRERVFDDAWEFLEIRSWRQGRVCAPNSSGFSGSGHLHGVRIFPSNANFQSGTTKSNEIVHPDQEMTRWNAAQVVAFIVSTWGDGNPLPRNKALKKDEYITKFQEWIAARKAIGDPVPTLPAADTLNKEFSTKSRPWNRVGWKRMSNTEISDTRFTAI